MLINKIEFIFKNIFNTKMDLVFNRARTGKRTKKAPAISNIAGFTRKKTNKTPNQIAVEKLYNHLKRYMPEIENNTDLFGIHVRDIYIKLLQNSEQIRFMNMAVLAQVLIYMYSVNDQVNSKNFSYELLERDYLDNILHDVGVKLKNTNAKELDVMRLRMAATFLRYIRYMTELISTGLDESEEETQPQEMLPIRGEEL